MWQQKWLGQEAWNNNNAESINHQLKIAKGKGKEDDLYRGSMQSEDHRRTALQ